MRNYLIIIIISLACFAASCSNPSPEAQKYISSNEATAANPPKSSNEVVDVTSQTPASSQESEAAKAEKSTAGKELKEVVSPKNFPKAIDQFAAAKQVWEKMKETGKKSGKSPFMFKIEDIAFINGEPLVEMKGEKSPVPLFETWDTSKLQGIDQVKSLISSGTQIQIKSRHETPDGNWYLITPIDSGLENVKGWVPEKLLTSIKPAPYEGFENRNVEGDVSGRSGRSGRRRGGI